MNRETIRNLIREKHTVKMSPCPFCGNTDKLRVEPTISEPGTFFVTCYNCDASGPWCTDIGKDAAIRIWNTRKTP